MLNYAGPKTYFLRLPLIEAGWRYYHFNWDILALVLLDFILKQIYVFTLLLLLRVTSKSFIAFVQPLKVQNVQNDCLRHIRLSLKLQHVITTRQISLSESSITRSAHIGWHGSPYSDCWVSSYFTFSSMLRSNWMLNTFPPLQ